MKSYVYGVSII